MYSLHNFFIWIRKNIIRILFKEYPNALLKTATVPLNNSQKSINLISSTENFWVSKSMFKKWDSYNEMQNMNVNIYSNSQVNNFMKEFYKEDLIYEIFRKSILPVQKIDIFRICIIYKFGGIWLDLKSQINLKKVLKLYGESESNGLLLCEPTKIDVTYTRDNKVIKSNENVIHNGFFFLPKESEFLRNLILKIKKDYLYFQDIVFSYPKEGIMNLTGPYQFTRNFFQIDLTKKPRLVSQNEIEWIYISKYGEFISPFKGIQHYSSLRQMKTIDSKKTSDLRVP